MAIEDLLTEDLSVDGSEIPFLEEDQDDIEESVVAGFDINNVLSITEEHEAGELKLIEEYSVRYVEDSHSRIKDQLDVGDLGVEAPALQTDDSDENDFGLLMDDGVTDKVNDPSTNLIEECTGDDLDSKAIEDLRAVDDLSMATPVVEVDHTDQNYHDLLMDDNPGIKSIELHNIGILSVEKDSTSIIRSKAGVSIPNKSQPALIEESRNDDQHDFQIPPLREIEITDDHPPGFGWKLKPIWHYENRMEALKYAKVRDMVRKARETTNTRKSTRIKHKNESDMKAYRDENRKS